MGKLLHHRSSGSRRIKKRLSIFIKLCREKGGCGLDNSGHSSSGTTSPQHPFSPHHSDSFKQRISMLFGTNKWKRHSPCTLWYEAPPQWMWHTMSPLAPLSLGLCPMSLEPHPLIWPPTTVTDQRDKACLYPRGSEGMTHPGKFLSVLFSEINSGGFWITTN